MKTWTEVEQAFKPVTNYTDKPVTNPPTETQGKTIQTVSDQFLSLAETIFNDAPESKYRDQALTVLLSAKYLVIQAIVHDWDLEKTSAA